VLTTAFVALCLFTQPAARAQTTGGSPDMVISQIYSRGGEPGATFRSDFVEIFNRGSVNVDINNWAIEVGGIEGQPNTTFVISFATSNNIIQPGKHFLFEFAQGAEGQTLPFADLPNFGFMPNISGAGAYVAIYRKSPTTHFGACPSGADLVDVVGFGTAICREGTASAPAPSSAQSLLRRDGGCTDSDNNANDFQLGAPNPRNSFFSAPTPCGGQQPSLVQLSKSTYEASEADDHFTVTINRTGNVNNSATVDYLTTSGVANSQKDYTPAFGTLTFAPGETSKTVDVLLTDDAFVEGDEVILFSLVSSTGVSLGTPKTASLVIHDNDTTPSSLNPSDDSQFFVRQHYHDFFNRAPDADGFNFWVQNIETCGADAHCREIKRINTSAAFFLSIEFQQTGFLAYRAHKAAFASLGNHPMGMPSMQMLQRDQQFMGRGVVVGQTGWEQALEANTRAYFDEFLTRFDFRQLYDGLSNAQYVDALNTNTAGVLNASERNALVNGLNSGTETRATVLRKVAENRAFSDAEKNRAFVLMQYYGYLRRNPNESPDTDFSGWQFWLDKLNSFNGNFVDAEMVKAFLVSTEYRARFGAQ
jgi:hypothetical protein